MKTIATFLILSCPILILFTIPTISSTSCLATTCHPDHGPEIRFPFRLTNRQPTSCGYPGFDLYCSSNNHTILNLTEAGDFVVNNIDYRKQTLSINDPGFCLPNRLLHSFTLDGSPFLEINPMHFTFYNCSSDRMEYDYELARLTLQCDDVRNYTFKPRDSNQVMPVVCRRMADVIVPMESGFTSNSFWLPLVLLRDLDLGWTRPACGKCETSGGTCGYANESETGLEIGCFFNSKGRGLQRNAKLGILIGVGIPILVCLVVLVSYSVRAIRASILRNSGVHVTRPEVRSPCGLDGHTIESYPKTVLGASRRLPDPSNVTCSICLSDYQPEETFRTIPDCNHYFHSDCIDDWLKLNGTCPLCRTLPQT